jgi:anti-sigma B factor antagonist
MLPEKAIRHAVLGRMAARVGLYDMLGPRRRRRRQELEKSLGRERSISAVEFKVSIDEHADTYSVVAVRGEVDLHTAPKVQYAIERGAEGVEAVVVDMGAIAFMDSTALSTLMRAKESLENKGTSLRLTAPSKAVERIFAVTGFGDYFDIYPSREAAIPE